MRLLPLLSLASLALASNVNSTSKKALVSDAKLACTGVFFFPSVPVLLDGYNDRTIISTNSWTGDYNELRDTSEMPVVAGKTLRVASSTDDGTGNEVPTTDYITVRVGAFDTGPVIAEGSFPDGLTFQVTTFPIWVHWHLSAACDTSTDPRITSVTCVDCDVAPPTPAPTPAPTDQFCYGEFFFPSTPVILPAVDGEFVEVSTGTWAGDYFGIETTGERELNGCDLLLRSSTPSDHWVVRCDSQNGPLIAQNLPGTSGSLEFQVTTNCARIFAAIFADPTCTTEYVSRTVELERVFCR